MLGKETSQEELDNAGCFGTKASVAVTMGFTCSARTPRCRCIPELCPDWGWAGEEQQCMLGATTKKTEIDDCDNGNFSLLCVNSVLLYQTYLSPFPKRSGVQCPYAQVPVYT